MSNKGVPPWLFPLLSFLLVVIVCAILMRFMMKIEAEALMLNGKK